MTALTWEGSEFFLPVLSFGGTSVGKNVGKWGLLCTGDRNVRLCGPCHNQDETYTHTHTLHCPSYTAVPLLGR